MYYKKVNVTDELPPNKGYYFTDFGYSYFNNGNWWDSERDEMNYMPTDPVEWWLKPLTLISREKMIEVIFKTAAQNNTILFKETCGVLADAILNAGIPEKEDIEEMIKKLSIDEYCINAPRKGINGDCWGVITKDKGFFAPTLTEAITNYYNSIK